MARSRAIAPLCTVSTIAARALHLECLNGDAKFQEAGAAAYVVNNSLLLKLD
jgi:hypothetical protein